MHLIDLYEIPKLEYFIVLCYIFYTGQGHRDSIQTPFSMTGHLGVIWTPKPLKNTLQDTHLIFWLGIFENVYSMQISFIIHARTYKDALHLL